MWQCYVFGAIQKDLLIFHKLKILARTVATLECRLPDPDPRSIANMPVCPHPFIA